MALYEFAAAVRRAILYAVVGTVVLVVLWFLYDWARDLYLRLNPPPEPPPTVGFGKLPQLRLPSLPIEGTPTYILDTATGALPEFDDRAKVVAITGSQPTLLGEEKARDLAKDLDFGREGTLSPDKKTLTFQDVPDGRTLAVDVTTQNFNLSTRLDRIRLLPKGSAPPGPEATKKAQEILARQGLLKFGFETGSQTTLFRAAGPDTAAEVGSISEAHFTEVNFFRSLTEVSAQAYPILPPDPRQGIIQVWVTTGLRPEILNILRITYRAQETKLDKTRVETYPLRNVSEAWEEIKNRQGVAFVGTKAPLTAVQITRVELAYFEDPIYQKYLQPIYVFSGVAKGTDNQEAEFIAYSQAVSTDWIEK